MSTALDPTPERTRTSAPGRRKDAPGKTWKLIGYALIVLGAAMVGAGRYAPSVIEFVAGFGIGGGSFALAGLVMVGVASMHKSLEAVRDATHDDTPMIEQVAADVIDVRSSLDKLQSQGEDFARELDAIRTKVHQPPPPPPPAQAVPESALAHSDALFHLATSLDKLGARFDNRLAAHHTSLQDKFEQLNSRFEETRLDFESRFAAPPPPARLVASEPLAAEHEPAPAQHEDESDAESLSDTGFQSADELVQGSTEPEPATPSLSFAPPAPPPPPASLGLLDTLGADRAHAPLPARTLSLDSAPSIAPSREAPSERTWDEQMMVEPPSPKPAAAEGDDTQQKLGQLRALLSDERLRAALESMRKAR